MNDLSLNRITNYQTSFVIDSRLAKDSFNYICRTLLAWIEVREKKLDRRFDRCKFYSSSRDFYDGRLEVHFPSKSSLKTLRCICEDRLLWGMEYVHKEVSQHTKMMIRLWHTEVYMTSFFKGEHGTENNGSAEKLVLFVRVSYSWNRSKFLEEIDARTPDPTAPGFIYKILDLKPHQDGLPYPFRDEVLLVTRQLDGENLCRLIQASQRRIHVLIIAMNVDATQKEKMRFLRKLGSRIVGKTVAFLVPPTSDAYLVLREHGLDIVNYHVYICPPITKESTRPQYVRIEEPVTDEKLDHLNERLCQFFYRNYFYVEDDVATSLDEIQIEILKQQRKRLLLEHQSERERVVEDSTRNYDDLMAKYEVISKPL